MRREKLNSILAANRYLIECKLENPNGYKVKLAQQLLNKKVGELLKTNSKLVIA